MSNVIDLEDAKLTKIANTALAFADDLIETLIELTPFESTPGQLEDLAALHDLAYVVASKRLVSPQSSV